MADEYVDYRNAQTGYIHSHPVKGQTKKKSVALYIIKQLSSSVKQVLSKSTLCRFRFATEFVRLR